MALFYNALIRGWVPGHEKISGRNSGGTGVIARALVSNKTKLPPTWLLKYGGKEALAGSIPAMELIRFASPSKPLQVYTNCKIPAKVYGSGRKRNALETDKKKDEEEKRETSPSNPKPKKTKSVKISPSLKLEKLYRNRSRPLRTTSNLGLRTVDVESGQVKAKAVPTTDPWRCYKAGLNLIGKCPRKECISNQRKATGNVMDAVIRKKGYGVVVLTPFDNKVTCPACNEGQFTPSNFLVSKGRALFRFKKSGPGQEVKQVLLESSSSSAEHYAMFDQTQEGESNYDIFEIRTVEETKSPYFCVECGEEIFEKENEVFSGCCKNPHHEWCRPAVIGSCSVCVAPMWDQERFNSSVIQID